ncbi:tripartite tricarboxylate transporter TctB family protein [Aidingimonas lacisalsi]|uniref:tripartite tricarboxylate transporter TctB family protein n=1 Tax=Aidingimonas lacisalsi TaxID=2604086 RepID=UPI0011D1C67A|nr:tripartite tricarboxylate transporter TctB family protein [Aidingimonas lacisalsi]
MTLKWIDRGVALLLGLGCTMIVATGLMMRGDAGVIPAIAGSLGIFACLGVGITTCKRAGDDAPPTPLPIYRFSIWGLCVLGLMVLMVSVGTIVALLLFLLASLRLLAGLGWRQAISIAVVFTALIYLVFAQLLGVPLPTGQLSFT